MKQQRPSAYKKLCIFKAFKADTSLQILLTIVLISHHPMINREIKAMHIPNLLCPEQTFQARLYKEPLFPGMTMS